MTTDELREMYLAFFEGKGHTRCDSDVLGSYLGSVDLVHSGRNEPNSKITFWARSSLILPARLPVRSAFELVTSRMSAARRTITLSLRCWAISALVTISSGDAIHWA